MKYFKILLRYYRGLAIIVLNTLLLLLIINIGLYVVFKINDNYFDDQGSNPVSQEYGNSPLKIVYPQFSEQDIHNLLRETWSRPYMYEQHTQFKERPYEGSFVNVDQQGYRYSGNQGTWPLDSNNYNVFLFGGSSAFGYGVPDDQTVASFLQESLLNKTNADVKIYNFGRGSYFSTQERILFESLLVSGHIPDMAIFLDGLNEFYYNDEKLMYTHVLEGFFDTWEKAKILDVPWVNKIPMIRLYKYLKYRADLVIEHRSKLVEQDSASVDFEGKPYEDDSLITYVVMRYLENKKIIEGTAKVYDVQPVFIWQPIPTYKYELDHHLFVGDGFGDHSYSEFGYQYMAELYKEQEFGNNFLWVADIQENLQQALYVDKVHYSAEMSELLAETICDLILERGLMR